ncbi:MAG: hypothetical protein PVI43_00460 [Candidatus Bathyarchaeota archaeon]
MTDPKISELAEQLTEPVMDIIRQTINDNHRAILEELLKRILPATRPIMPTSKTPTEEGFYWLYVGGRGCLWQVVQVYRVEEHMNTVSCSGLRFGEHWPGVGVDMVSREALWAGPLTPPGANDLISE